MADHMDFSLFSLSADRFRASGYAEIGHVDPPQLRILPDSVSDRIECLRVIVKCLCQKQVLPGKCQFTQSLPEAEQTLLVPVKFQVANRRQDLFPRADAFAHQFRCQPACFSDILADKQDPPAAGKIRIEGHARKAFALQLQKMLRHGCVIECTDGKCLRAHPLQLIEQRNLFSRQVRLALLDVNPDTAFLHLACRPCDSLFHLREKLAAEIAIWKQHSDPEFLLMLSLFPKMDFPLRDIPCLLYNRKDAFTHIFFHIRAVIKHTVHRPPGNACKLSYLLYCHFSAQLPASFPINCSRRERISVSLLPTGNNSVVILCVGRVMVIILSLTVKS